MTKTTTFPHKITYWETKQWWTKLVIFKRVLCWWFCLPPSPYNQTFICPSDLQPVACGMRIRDIHDGPFFAPADTRMWISRKAWQTSPFLHALQARGSRVRPKVETSLMPLTSDDLQGNLDLWSCIREDIGLGLVFRVTNLDRWGCNGEDVTLAMIPSGWPGSRHQQTK